MMKSIKKWWFYVTLPILLICAIAAIPSAGDIKPCINDSKKEKGCYLFYGIAQNSIERSGGILKVNYLIKGFPSRRHSVYVEIVHPNGEVDFLYSEEHTKSHRAHLHKDGGLRKYAAKYKISNKLPKGIHKLRVTFEFDTPGWGRLNRDKLVSNEIKFEVK